MFISIIPKARDYSMKYHEGAIITTISNFKRPQILHFQEVADLVWASGGTDNEIASAWLHDIVEDTKVTIEDIEKNFGKNIMNIVNGLTDPEEFKDMLLRIRKQKQAKRLANESDSVKRIKISDQISNIRSIIDPINDMTPELCDKYLGGADSIAKECNMISELLDNFFLKTFSEGKKIVAERILNS